MAVAVHPDNPEFRLDGDSGFWFHRDNFPHFYIVVDGLTEAKKREIADQVRGVLGITASVANHRDSDVFGDGPYSGCPVDRWYMVRFFVTGCRRAEAGKMAQTVADAVGMDVRQEAWDRNRYGHSVQVDGGRVAASPAVPKGRNYGGASAVVGVSGARSAPTL